MNKTAQITIIVITVVLLGLLLIFAGILQGKLVLPEQPGSSHRQDRETTEDVTDPDENTTDTAADETDPAETEEATQPPRNPNREEGSQSTTPPTTDPPPTAPPVTTPPVTTPPPTDPPETQPPVTEEPDNGEDEFPPVPLG